MRLSFSAKEKPREGKYVVRRWTGSSWRIFTPSGGVTVHAGIPLGGAPGSAQKNARLAWGVSLPARNEDASSAKRSRLPSPNKSQVPSLDELTVGQARAADKLAAFSDNCYQRGGPGPGLQLLRGDRHAEGGL